MAIGILFLISANMSLVKAEILTFINVTQYYSQTNTVQTFQQFGTLNGRTFFADWQSNTSAVLWSEFNSQMAWIVMINNTISFISNSDVQDPRLAKNWKYFDSDRKLMNASMFNSDTVSVNGN